MSEESKLEARREAVVEEALSWVGTPFRMNAAIRGVGADCGRLLCAIYGAAGIVVPSVEEHFPKDWHLHTRRERYLEIIKQYTREIDGSPLPGDVAVFRVGRVFGHGAVVVRWPQVVHAHWEHGVQHADATQSPLAGRAVVFLSPF